MVVRCIKTSIDADDPYIINRDMRDFLRIGDEYIVYGIRMKLNKSIYFMVFDGNHLVEVPSPMFEIIDGRVSSLWVVQNEGDNIRLWPELFYEDDFLENFSEWEDRERKKFEKLKQYFEKASQ